MGNALRADGPEYLRRGLVAFGALIALTLLWPAITWAFPAKLSRSSAPIGPVLFVDATSLSGLLASQEPCLLDGDKQYFVTGQAWGDADGNGIADLYLTNQCGPSTLYSGDGRAHFQPSPVTDQVALAGRQAGGAVFADLDGDGWSDLLVLTYDGPVLFHNDSGRGFVDVTTEAGLYAIEGAHPVSATLADYDQDGALDVFLANYGCIRCLASPRDEVRSQLFHNRGDGRFVDVSSVLGGEGPMGFSFVAGWGDFDNDGDPDLYVTNDVRGGRTLHGNALYRNDGPGCGEWCFTNVSQASGAGVRADAMGLARADFNGDGALDIFITNSGWAYTMLTGPSVLLTNRGDGTFQDSSASAGAEVDAMAWGAAALDVDSDGWTDLYVALGTDPAGQGEWATTNRLLRNLGGGHFEDVTKRSGAADTADSFGVAVGDANGDGQPDIVVGDYNAGYRLFLGTGGGAVGHRLVVSLTGAGPVNHDAVGARIEAVLSDGRRLVHEVSLGGTLGGNDEPAFRTGTGTASVSQLNVRWPNGYEQAISDVPIDSEVRWTYANTPEIRPLPAIGAHVDQLYDSHTSGLRLRMVMPVGGGLACFALVALWLVGRRRSVTLSYAAGGVPSVAPPVAPHLTTASLPRLARSLRLRGHDYPVILPSLRDPRLHLASVIVSLQVLGQTVLGFQLSIAQILVSLLTCAIIEFTITFRQTRSIVWPASALLTGNGVAFILRVPGTEHGDWWSLNGWYLFAGIAGVSLLSKYLIRDNGRHVFNPSNFGLVLGFLLLGSSRVEPLDFWWGPLSPGVLAAFVVILAGGPIILSRLQYLGMAISFWLTFAAGLAVIAAGGHCMSARWSFEPVCGWSFWRVLVASPEILVFMFFMMTDPKTTPAGRVARIVFGVSVAFLAALFLAPQQTEFSTKVAVLASLAVVCALQPLMQRFLPAAGSERDTMRALLATFGGGQIQRGMAPSWAKAARYAGLALFVGSASLASLIASGVSARVPMAGLQAAEATVNRPVIEIESSGLPPVSIEPAMRRLDADITDTRATEIARDVAVDLKIEAEALKKADRELAKTAVAGARLNSLWRQMDVGRQAGQITASSYTFDSMKLVPVYDSANAQAGPQYGLEVRGTVHRATYEGPSAARLVRQEDESFECTFALLLKNGHFLIAADYPRPRT